MVVPASMAYNIFQRQTHPGRERSVFQLQSFCGLFAAKACTVRPDLARKVVEDPVTGQQRPVALGEDYKGRPVDRDRDVWVVRIADERGQVRHAEAGADGLLRLLETRLSLLRQRGDARSDAQKAAGQGPQGRFNTDSLS